MEIDVLLSFGVSETTHGTASPPPALLPPRLRMLPPSATLGVLGHLAPAPGRPRAASALTARRASVLGDHAAADAFSRPIRPRRARRRASSRARAPPRPGRATTFAKLDLSLDLGQVLGSVRRGEGALNLPPGRVGLFGLRETFAYLADPNRFVSDRVAKHGPVFKTAIFFKPAIVFGTRDALREFRAFEAALEADGALPETFRELHTEYGALRQSGEKHQATRANFGAALGRKALAAYAPVLARRTRDFVQTDVLTAKGGRLQPGYDCRQHCLATLFELFVGVVPPEDVMDLMYAYNEGLLALGKISPEFEEGKKALERLTAFVLKHYRTVKAQGKLDEDDEDDSSDKYYFFKAYSKATDEHGEPFSDERIATTAVLMVWGAYIEAAASMGHTLWCLMRHPAAMEKARLEARRAFPEKDDLGRDCERRVTLDVVYAELKYLDACAKEALRYVPQTAGGLRVNDRPRTLGGFDVPEGYVLTADPRVAFLDPERFPEPKEYRPERFLAGSNPPGPDDYFPGGVGAHACPGISLATFMTQVFLAYVLCTFDEIEPDLEGEGSEDPEYIPVPIVIIDDKYRLKMTRNWRYDM